ncbi:hypothetical protein ACNPKZ_22280 [Shewanella algae]
MVLISRAGALAIHPAWAGRPRPGKVSSWRSPAARRRVAMGLGSHAGAPAIDPVWPGTRAHPGYRAGGHQLPGGVAMVLISRAGALAIHPAWAGQGIELAVTSCPAALPWF